MRFEFVEEPRRGAPAYQATIKVVGIGGGGGNALNNMILAKVKGVDFIAANTDCQDLERSQSPFKIQLGPNITNGLGAGADPEVGRAAAEESEEEIERAVKGANMVFLTAGMGGGTGTGAAPIIARICKEVGALTVAVVTKPFSHEGNRRMEQAIEGIKRLEQEVDSLIVIPNDRLRGLSNRSTSFKELLARADDVLLYAVRGISELITNHGFINLDFADVRKVMSKNGKALMGMGRASGENRSCEAAQRAIHSPLLDDICIAGAKGLLMNFTGPSDMTMDEIDEASNYVKNEVNDDAEIFWGVAFDDSMNDEIQVTVIATGIESAEEKRGIRRPPVEEKGKKVVKIREVTPEDLQSEWTVRKPNGEWLDIPTFQRMGGTSSTHSKEQPDSREERRGLFSKLLHREDLDTPTYQRAKAD